MRPKPKKLRRAELVFGQRVLRGRHCSLDLLLPQHPFGPILQGSGSFGGTGVMVGSKVTSLARRKLRVGS